MGRLRLRVLHLPFELKIQSVDVADQSFSAAGLKYPAQGGWKYGLKILPGMPRSPTIRSMMFSSSVERPSAVVDKTKNAVERLLHLDPLAREMWVSTLLICGWA